MEQEKRREIIYKYNKHAQLVIEYINGTFRDSERDLIVERNHNVLFSIFPSLEKIYKLDEHFIQNTPTKYLNHETRGGVGRDFSNLYKESYFEESKCYTSSYYISDEGEPCIRIVKKESSGYEVYTFKIAILLREMGLINQSVLMKKLEKITYVAFGAMLMISSLFLLWYAVAIYYQIFFTEIHSSRILEKLFESIISITLGMAIFDLAKTVIDKEVVRNKAIVANESDAKVLKRFMTSIIIAISIEALVMVFKITMSDYKEIGYAVILMFGVFLLLVGTAFFSKGSHHSQK